MDAGNKTITFPNIAVLVSGSGSNLQAIIDDEIPVALVLSDRPNVNALERASNVNIDTVVIDRSEYKGQREVFTSEIVKALKEKNIDLIILAGFMTILSAEIFEAYENHVINIHPSLLPAFKGAHAVESALEAGVQVTGCTVHIATANVDDGPILAQESVDILPGDNADSLHERIQKVEHSLYPRAIRQFITSKGNNDTSS